MVVTPLIESLLFVSHDFHCLASNGAIYKNGLFIAFLSGFVWSNIPILYEYVGISEVHKNINIKSPPDIFN